MCASACKVSHFFEIREERKQNTVHGKVFSSVTHAPTHEIKNRCVEDYMFYFQATVFKIFSCSPTNIIALSCRLCVGDSISLFLFTCPAVTFPVSNVILHLLRIPSTSGSSRLFFYACR